MSGAIRPFNDLKVPAKNGAATVRYVERRLREVLGRLHFTGKGVKTSAEGQVHIDFEPPELFDHPFKITPVDGGVTISPGLLRLNEEVTLRVGNVPIVPPANRGNWQSPVLSVPQGQSDIVIDLSYTPVFGSVSVFGVPISFIMGSRVIGQVEIRAMNNAPAERPAPINYPQGTAGNGFAYIRLGRVNRSEEAITVLVQDWSNNIAATCQGDGALFLAAR